MNHLYHFMSKHREYEISIEAKSKAEALRKLKQLQAKVKLKYWLKSGVPPW